MEDTTSQTAIGIEGTSLSDKVESDANLEDIYDSFADSLFRYAVTITGSADDAEDAVQEVFTRLARDRRRTRQAQNLKAYLFAATRNSAFSVLRSRKRRREVQESVCDELQAERGREGVSLESAEVCQAFMTLPVEQREVLTLKIYDEMTFKEIAATVGASMGTVTARYRYGIAKVRRSLEEDSDG